jgi:prepilin-type N-terminal cleavage/methylation domain-containing protein
MLIPIKKIVAIPHPSSRVFKAVFKKLVAFTLAELLIALAILGLAAGFTIPKVLTASNNAQTKAILKEDIGIISTVLQKCEAENRLYTQSASKLNNSVHGCFLDHLNTVSSDYCQNNISACNVGGVVLHNGSTLSLNYGYPIISVDVNGSAPPNVVMQDRFDLMYCTSDYCYAYQAYMPNKPGVVFPCCNYLSDYADRLAYWTSLWQ